MLWETSQEDLEKTTTQALEPTNPKLRFKSQYPLELNLELVKEQTQPRVEILPQALELMILMLELELQNTASVPTREERLSRTTVQVLEATKFLALSKMCPDMNYLTETKGINLYDV